MMVVSDNKTSVSRHSAINKLVVVGVGGNDVEFVVGRDEQRIGIVDDDIQGQRGEGGRSLALQYLCVFGQYLGGHTKLVAAIQEGTPQLMVATTAGNTLYKRIGVKNKAAHGRSVLGV